MKITDFLKIESTENEAEKELVQGKVDKTLKDRTHAQMKKDGITWNDLVEAACKLYMSERDKKRPV